MLIHAQLNQVMLTVPYLYELCFKALQTLLYSYTPACRCIQGFPTVKGSFKFWDDASKLVTTYLSSNQPEKELITMSSVRLQQKQLEVKQVEVKQSLLGRGITAFSDAASAFC